MAAKVFCFRGVAVLMIMMILVSWGTSVRSYERPPARNSVFVSVPQDSDSTSPQQVHISLEGNDKMRISWITEDLVPSTVDYGTSSGFQSGLSATGTFSTYKYAFYTSGYIHDVIIGPLKPSTTYFYRCGSSSQEFNFKTPPPQFPIKFAVVGDLGQTEWTRSTLDHISKSNYDLLILPGDLSYADFDQPKWDSFGRLVEPLASQRPWMVTQGNHEVEKIPIIHNTPFTAYNARWIMPYAESGSSSNLYYSFEVAGVHVIMLGSYTDFSSGSDQYQWLQADLSKVDRKRTPWLFVIIHAPWYNSNTAHQGESESVDMKASMEDLIYGAHTDIVFSGHVHAYERFTRVYKDQANNCGPVYINIGDGGNREGLASKYQYPQPSISLFREASFGHGELEVVNSTYAQWTWHRNADDEAVASDQLWLQSLASNTACAA
ncbi:Purple acid phosphatase [Heracleum sosnowskyi]|uniref:Purple acid phosphatase n=1 Tax=Heracleum sosnowskyi TaxID=360622 RepID=A0AAD8MJK6_9APIA|nr:Purple acid phosphatase [Heracleum sosnowskyi]